MLTEIRISNLRIHGFHGVKDAEKSLGQIFEVDLSCTILRKNPLSDRMDDTLCYGELCDLVCEVSTEAVFNLIETLAERIVDKIFERYDVAQGVEIEIRKPSAPLTHIVDHVGVALSRTRHG